MSYDDAVLGVAGSFVEEEIDEETIKLTLQNSGGLTNVSFGVDVSKGDVYGVRYKLELPPGSKLKLKDVRPLKEPGGGNEDYVYSKVSDSAIDIIWLPVDGKSSNEAKNLFNVEVETGYGGTLEEYDITVKGEIVYQGGKSGASISKNTIAPVAEVSPIKRGAEEKSSCLAHPNPTSAGVYILLEKNLSHLSGNGRSLFLSHQKRLNSPSYSERYPSVWRVRHLVKNIVSPPFPVSKTLRCFCSAS